MPGINNVWETFYILVVLSVFTAFQRLVLHLKNLFLLASTFKPNGSSSSTDENKENKNYKAWRKWKWSSWSIHLIPKVCLSINQAPPTIKISNLSLVSTAPPSASSSECGVAAPCTSQRPIECEKSLLASRKKNSRPPSLLHPDPGPLLPGFPLPSSSPCHQEVVGRGYLLSGSQYSCCKSSISQSNEIFKNWSSCQPAVIGKYWSDLPGNLRSPG